LKTLTELENYLTRIEDLRSQILGQVKSFPLEALNWRPVGTNSDHKSNPIAALIAHISGAEHFWIGEVIGGLPATRNRDAEFAAEATSVESILDLLRRSGNETQKVLTSMRNTDLDKFKVVKGRHVPVRWCILHVIDHTSLHLGHIQITYQLWSGGKEMESPIWSDRLPKWLN